MPFVSTISIILDSTAIFQYHEDMIFLEKFFNAPLLQTFWHDRYVRATLFSAIALNVLSWVVLLTQSRDLTAVKALHYNIYFGIDWLGPWYRVFLLPLVGLIFFAVDFYLANFFYGSYRILSYLLAATASFVQFILLLSCVFIVWINLI